MIPLVSAGLLNLRNSVTGYSINSAALFSGAANLTRTFTTSDRKTWTLSVWVTRSKTGTLQTIFSGYSAGNALGHLYFDTDDRIKWYDYTSGFDWRLETTAVFRDVTSPMHIVVSRDTTQATASERARIFINGSQVTSFSVETYPSLNFDGYINNNLPHYFGAYDGTSAQFDGYMADVRFVSGVRLEATSFGEFNSGNWEPIEYTGTYGTNGFYLKFEDGALGTDSSGNGNDWTVNGTVTAVTNTPTDVKAVLNALDTSGGTLSNGNQTWVSGSAVFRSVKLTLMNTDEPTYLEVLSDVGIGNGNSRVGIVKATEDVRSSYIGQTANSYGYASNGNKYNNGSATAYGSTWSATNVVGVAWNPVIGALWFIVNGTPQNGATISEIETGDTTNAAFTGLTADDFMLAISSYSTDKLTIRVSEDDWTETRPSNFKALTVANMTPNAITTGTAVSGEYFYTGGVPSNISGVTTSAIYALGFVPSSSGAFTCDVDNPIGGTVMPRGQAN